MNRLPLIAIIVAFLSPGIYAQNYNPKFDKAPDLVEFLKAATEDPSFQTCVPFPKQGILPIETSGLDKKQPLTVKSSLMPAQPGFLYGSFPRHISANPDYPIGKKYADKLQGNQNPVAQDLLRDWDKINTTGGSLLKDANSMDSTDTGLYAEGVQIDKNAAALNQERERLSADINAYNAKCAGQPVSTYCTNWYNKLVAWQNDLQKRIAAHNKYVEAWRSRVKTFKSTVDSWIGNLTFWEQYILDFISKAESYIYGATGNCGAQQHAALQQAVNDACHSGEKRGCKQWNPGNPTLDCAKWKEYLGDNLACYNARHDINTICYDGGNPGHTDAEDQAAAAIQNCQDLISDFCKKSITASIPGRRYGFGF